MRAKIGGDIKVRRAYEPRDAVLKALGYPNYKAYLKSTAWRGIRREQVRLNGECVVCGNPAEEIHHVRYDRATMEGKSPENLKSLCAGHHRECEFDGWGRKQTPRQAANRLKRMIAAQRG